MHGGGESGRPGGPAPLLDALAAASTSLSWRGCVPGHKGGAWVDGPALELIGQSPYALDLPHDIAGVDGRTDGPSPYDEARRLLAEAYGARRAWFLTQGGSQGIIAATIAVADRGRRVLLQRSAHISLFSGLALTGLDATFLPDAVDPRYGVPLSLTRDALAQALAKGPEVGAVFVTSPTYHGAVADVAGLAEVAHRAGAALVVDCSWGPHFGLDPRFPPSPTAVGADVAVVSTHKHLGSLGQSGVLLSAPGGRLTDHELDDALALITSTSASYLLAASVDAARRRATSQADRLAARALRTRRDAIAAIGHTPFTVVPSDDPLRLIIDVATGGYDGTTVSRMLENEHGIICESSGPRLIGFVLGLGETFDALRPAVDILCRLPARAPLPAVVHPAPAVPLMKATVQQARFGPRRRVAWADAVGEISAETLAVYPPGFPVFIAGEVISAAHCETLQAAVREGRRVHGATDPTGRGVRVVDTAAGRPLGTSA